MGKFFILLFSVATLCAEMIPPLTEMMSLEDQKKTGVIRLKLHERQELAKWLFNHGCKDSTSASNQSLTVSININGGAKLKLSDGSMWQVSPSDQNISSSWLSAIPIKIYPSGDQDFPKLLVNTSTKQSVKAKPLVE